MSASSTFPKQTKTAAASATTTTSGAPSVTIPIVDLPVLSPGFPLAPSTAALEASTSHYFQPGQSLYGKRGRPEAESGAEAVNPHGANVLDTLYVEENARVVHGEAAESNTTSASPSSLSNTSTSSAASTRAHLLQLYRDPQRCELDKYRRVDVAGCRRGLQEVERAMTEDVKAAKALKDVSAYNSCFTVGQHHRYRDFVVEWLRHQPSRCAPPDSGEVLKLVQAEQRLFVAALRREATTRLASPSPCVASLYDWLTPSLLGYAKQWRLARMRQQLLSFLRDAKAHEGEVLLCCCPPAASDTGAEDTAAEADYGGVTFEDDGVDEAASHRGAEAKAYTLTPQQRFQRRYPSLRVLQWHMAKLYNSQQASAAPPFPYPQLRSSVVCVPAVDDGARVQKSSPHSGAAAQRGEATACPSRLLLRNLPHFTADDAGGDEHDIGGAVVENDEKKAEHRDHETSTGASTFAADPALQPSAVPATPISVASLRTYVEEHLLPRFGWRVSKVGGTATDDATQTAPTQPEDLVESISLSATFAGLLKLFVAHLDTEEPRTSFRVPVRVQLTPLAPSTADAHRNSSEVVTPTARFHAHVVLGAAVPNVKESRQSVQAAAAAHLLQRHRSSEPTTASVSASSNHKGQALASSPSQQPPAATPRDEPVSTREAPERVSAKVAARVELTRSATMRNTVVQSEAAVHAAGGNRIKASAAALLSMKEAVADTAPTLPFCVSAPPSALAPSEISGARVAASAGSGVTLEMVKMEHLNATSAARRGPSAAAGVAVNGPVQLSKFEIAEPCPHLLAALSPREMLQLDLLFACFPGAAARLHHVQLRPPATGDADAENEGSDDEGSMQVLAVQTLTQASWALLRQQLLHRPAESLTATPSPSEVLSTQSWDLLFDTLMWLLDSVVRHAADALRVASPSSLSAGRESEEGDEAKSALDGGADLSHGGDRFAYFILSNHANLVNTSASAKVDAKRIQHGDRTQEVVTATFTESRFAVRYVLQDALELYPDYEPRINIVFEAENLSFLEEAGGDEAAQGSEGNGGSEEGVNAVAARLYRDPHTWNLNSIPFTFHRKVQN